MSSHPSDAVPLYIAAGGKSSRFGSDKARAEIDGMPLILRIARQLQPIIGRVTVVADRAGKYDDLGLRTINDLLSDRGPMGALQAALRDVSDDGWLLLVSCDFVSAKAAWITRLIAHYRTDAKAVAFRHERWEPLLALYSTSLREEVDLRIASGRLSPQKMLDEIDAVAVPVPADWPAICQVNSMADMERYLASRDDEKRGMQ